MAIQYATDENFYELVGQELAVVDFFGPNCVPCKMLARVLEEVADDMPFVNIVKVDTSLCPKLTEEYKINGIPDMYYFKDGVVKYHDLGVSDGDAIRQKISELMYE